MKILHEQRLRFATLYLQLLRYEASRQAERHCLRYIIHKERRFAAIPLPPKGDSPLAANDYGFHPSVVIIYSCGRGI